MITPLLITFNNPGYYSHNLPNVHTLVDDELACCMVGLIALCFYADTLIPEGLMGGHVVQGGHDSMHSSFCSHLGIFLLLCISSVTRYSPLRLCFMMIWAS